MRKNIKNRFLSATLTVLVAGAIITSASALPVQAADNTASKVSTTISSIFSKAKDFVSSLSSNQTLIDNATKSVNSLLNNSNITKSVVDNAQSLINKIPNNDQTKNAISQLQSALDKAKNFLNDKAKIDDATNNLNNFLKNPASQTKTAAKNVVSKAQDLLNKLADTDQNKNLKSQLQSLIDKANNYLNK